MKQLALALLLGLIPALLPAATVDLGAHGTFKIDLPEGWTIKSSALMEQGIGLSFNPPPGTDEKCLMTLMFQRTPTPVDPGKIDTDVFRACRTVAETSVEKKATLASFNMAKGYGSYSVFTDAELVGKPVRVNNWKVFGTGKIGFNSDVVASVSLFTNDLASPGYAALLKAIAGATVTK